MTLRIQLIPVAMVLGITLPMYVVYCLIRNPGEEFFGRHAVWGQQW